MNTYFNITQREKGELEVTLKPMKEYFQISQEKSGVYNVHFSGDEQTIKDLKEITQEMGFMILYTGSYEYEAGVEGFEISKKKFNIIQEMVEQANKEGKFDPKMLEERLKLVK